MPRRETRLGRPDDEINRQVAAAFVRSLHDVQEIGNVITDTFGNVVPMRSVGRLHWSRHLVIDSRELNLTFVTQPNPPYCILSAHTIDAIRMAFATRFSLSETTLPRMKRCDNPYLDANHRSRMWKDDSGQMWMMFVKCPEFAIVEESHGLDQFGTDTDEPAPHHHFIDRVFVEMLIHVEFVAITVSQGLDHPQNIVFPTSQQLSDIAQQWIPPPTYHNGFFHAANPNINHYSGGFCVPPTPSSPQEPEEEVELSSLKNSLKHSLKGLGEGCREMRFTREGSFKPSDN